MAVAAHRNYTEVVKALLDAGADVHAGDDMALRWAAESGCLEAVKILLAVRTHEGQDAGADVHAGKDQALCSAANRGNTKIIKMLLDAGADTSIVSQRVSPQGKAEILRLLMEANEEHRSSTPMPMRMS